MDYYEDEIERLRNENEALRLRLASLEKEREDENDPCILILRGKLSYYGGEWTAWHIRQPNGQQVFLAEAVEEFIDNLRRLRGNYAGSERVTVGWHTSSVEKTHAELEMNLISTVLGAVDASFHHHYSDLTGYLWTTENINVSGRDIMKEMHLEDGHYLYLRAQLHTDQEED